MGNSVFAVRASIYTLVAAVLLIPRTTFAVDDEPCTIPLSLPGVSVDEVPSDTGATLQWRDCNQGPELPPPPPPTPTPPPAATPISEQALFNYEVRSGYFNSDGVLDLRLARTDPDASLDGTIGTLILIGSTSGAYSYTVPSQQQAAATESWQLLPVQVVKDDFNSDGFIDVMLIDENGSVPVGNDIIIYAPGQMFNANPKGIKKVDSSFMDFVSDASEWSLNHRYFSDNGVFVESGYWGQVKECELLWHEDPWGDYGDYGDFPEWVCTFYDEWIDTSYWEYPTINDVLVDVYEKWGDYRRGNASYGETVEIFEEIFGSVIGSPQYCSTVGSYYFDELESAEDECSAVSITRAVEAVRRSREWRNTDYGFKYGRAIGRIHVTAHKVMGLLPRHLALEYIDPLSGGETTISAGPSAPLLYSGGL